MSDSFLPTHPLSAKQKNIQSGFTLIELSIALVIIGLLVGGVLVGRDLIRVAELRNTGSMANQIIMKIRIFKERYGQYPGDTNKAWAIWGTQCAGSIGDCNGDNNGMIGNEHYRVSHGGNRGEDSCVFKQLELAGLWNGSVDAAACTNTSTGIGSAKINAHPAVAPVAIDSLMWHVGAWNLYQSKRANAVTITAPTTAWGGAYMFGGTLQRLDAQSLDTKFDDGQPASGKVFASGNDSTSGCTNIDGQNTSAASLTWFSSSFNHKACNVHFWVD